jgi:cholesterol oxidase
VERRTFIKASTAVGLLSFAPVARAQVGVRRIKRQAVIIGSGFGGSVSALRLTQAGVRVTLLEQGRAWPTGPNATTFPTLRTADERVLFYGAVPGVLGVSANLPPYAGLLNVQAGPAMTALSGVGLGGGSLTYQGMTLTPARSVFEHEFPAAIDYDEMLQEHYATVGRMLGAATAPPEILDAPTYKASRSFKRRAEAAGFTVDRIPMPIDWSYAVRELHGEMTPSYTNGDCALGVNNGGKNSLDVTYLKQATETGRLEVRLLHRATEIYRTPAGEWEVHAARTDLSGNTLENVVVTAPILVMGAGSSMTSRLLVRAGALGHIPDLPDGLGGNWGTNADRIYSWTPLDEDLGAPQGGPVVYGSKEWDDPAFANTVVQASIPPLLLPGDGFDTHSTILVGYGVSKGRGRWVYDPALDTATLLWPPDGDLEIQTKRNDPRIRAIAGPESLLVDTNDVLPWTWHAMGGASMGTVCDHEGRVHGQRGLYVLDGAILPGSAAACNPSMTIAALAERAMKRIVRHELGRVS